MTNILIIDINGNINDKKITNINKFIKGNNLKELYYWNYLKYKYKAFIEFNKKNLDTNKHKLPPFGISSIADELSNVELIYGDIYIFKECNKKYISLSMEDYCEFYSIISTNYSDSDSDCEVNKDDNTNFILETEEEENKINLDEKIEYEKKNTNIDNIELDTDTNNYLEYINA